MTLAQKAIPELPIRLRRITPFGTAAGSPCVSCVSGRDYTVAMFRDSSGLAVIHSTGQVYAAMEEMSYGEMDRLASVGRLLTELDPETRARQARECGTLVVSENDGSELYRIAGTAWRVRGSGYCEFAGLR